MYTSRGKKYIYAVNFANELIQKGYRCIETGVNPTSNKYFWVFDYNEVQSYYNDREKNVRE